VTTAAIGGCHTLFVSAIFATIVAFLYLSIPFAIELTVAVSLGIGLSVLLLYISLGRQFVKLRPPHPSEFAE
jgi:hypothetical protein